VESDKAGCDHEAGWKVRRGSLVKAWTTDQLSFGWMQVSAVTEARPKQCQDVRLQRRGEAGRGRRTAYSTSDSRARERGQAARDGLVIESSGLQR